MRDYIRRLLSFAKLHITPIAFNLQLSSSLWPLILAPGQAKARAQRVLLSLRRRKRLWRDTLYVLCALLSINTKRLLDWPQGHFSTFEMASRVANARKRDPKADYPGVLRNVLGGIDRSSLPEATPAYVQHVRLHLHLMLIPSSGS